jgi:Tol biopolymer transport system component
VANLAEQPDRTGDDVFVRDLRMHETTLVPRPGPGHGPPAQMKNPVISANGRFVAYEAHFSDEERERTFQLVFVHDMVERTTELASRASGHKGRRDNSDAFLGSISGDGRLVTFQSQASNLTADDREDDWDVFVRDTQSDHTTLVSRATRRARMDEASYQPVISADGRFVAYTRALLFDDRPREPPAQILVRHLETGKAALVSRASGHFGRTGRRDSSEPAISADGRFVAFQSEAPNLGPADGDIVSDVFVHDRLSHRTALFSRASGESGAKGNNASSEPSLSGDGRTVAFTSYANNLVRARADRAAPDVFVRRIACVGVLCRSWRR